MSHITFRSLTQWTNKVILNVLLIPVFVTEKMPSEKMCMIAEVKKDVHTLFNLCTF